MRRKRPPFVEIFNDRHGKQRIYFRRGKGPRVALPGPLNSDIFHEAYAAALAGNVAKPKPSPTKDAPGTIGALIQKYMESSDYKNNLAQTTKNTYSNVLKKLREQHGHRTIAGLTRSRIITGVLDPIAGKPGAYRQTLKIIRILIKRAMDLEWIESDPTVGIKRPKLKEVYTWKDREIAQFENFWPIGTRQRTGFAIFLYTGQRLSDVYKMSWDDIERQFIYVIQQKTGAELMIPIHRELAIVLAAMQRDQPLVATTDNGKPTSLDNFSHFLREAITKAGLPMRCRPHGLRKAAARRLAEAGCTAHEIMALTGHKTLSEVERYTRAADQKRMAVSAVHRLERGNPEDNPQT